MIDSRKATLLILVLLAVAAPVVAGEGERARHPDELTFEAPELVIPKPERLVLDNGMVLWFQEDRELPVVDVTMWFRSGSKYEPADKAGLAMMTGAYARAGGAGAMNRLQFDEALEFLAASLGARIEGEHGQVNLNVLRKDLDRGLELMATMVRKPAFDPMIFPLLRQSFASQIARRGDSPGGILAERFPGLLYGEHPYGHVPTMATVSAITRDDCVEFWNRSLAAGTIYLGVAGDVSKDEIVEKLNAVFGDFRPEPRPWPEVPALERTYDHKVYLIPRPVTQSHIRIAERLVKRTDPERNTLDVMNMILGSGSFASRLTRLVRVQEGLAYSVMSMVERREDLGLWTASVQTKGETTWKAIDLILGEMKRIRTEPVTDEELTVAKDSILNGLAFNRADPFPLVENFLSVEYHGYPEDFIETFPQRIAAVTKEDILRVAQKYLHPDKVTIVIVGNPEIFDERPEDVPEPVVLEP
jgi:predicted Zn-dependent peptidase